MAHNGKGGGNPLETLNPLYLKGFLRKYREQGSNLHALRHRILNPARLPIPPSRLVGDVTVADFSRITSRELSFACAADGWQDHAQWLAAPNQMDRSFPRYGG